MYFLESPETQVTAQQTYLAQNPKLRFLQIVTVRQYWGASRGSFGRRTRIKTQKKHILSRSREFPSIMHCTRNFSGYLSWKEPWQAVLVAFRTSDACGYDIPYCSLYVLLALFKSCVSLIRNGKEVTLPTQGSAEEASRLRVCRKALRRQTSPSLSCETWAAQGVPKEADTWQRAYLCNTQRLFQADSPAVAYRVHWAALEQRVCWATPWNTFFGNFREHFTTSHVLPIFFEKVVG